jgi:hypothetical protein
VAEDVLSPGPSVGANSSADDVSRLLLSPAHSQPVVLLTPLNPSKDGPASKVIQRTGQDFS